MYRIFPIRTIVILVATIALGLFLIRGLALEYGIEVRIWAVVSLVWPVLLLLSVNWLWRKIWWVSKRVSLLPDLNEKVFPDLNGKWRVELQSNFSRQQQLLEAAKDRRKSFDPVTCSADQLAPLMPRELDAEIEQTWWSMKLTVTDTAESTPIKQSDTYHFMPIKKSEKHPASISYFFDQKNDTDEQSDVERFNGAATLEYNPQTDTLSGTFWTARNWRRAMNSAGQLTLHRQT